jgi:hypothetical protein
MFFGYEYPLIPPESVWTVFSVCVFGKISVRNKHIFMISRKHFGFLGLNPSFNTYQLLLTC